MLKIKASKEVEISPSLNSFEQIVQFLDENLKLKLAQLPAGEKMVEQFLMKGLLDEFIPQFDKDEDIAQF